MAGSSSKRTEDDLALAAWPTLYRARMGPIADARRKHRAVRKTNMEPENVPFKKQQSI